MCNGECEDCKNFDNASNWCKFFQVDNPDPALTPSNGFVFSPYYVEDELDCEEELITRNTSGASLELLKIKFPSKVFI